MHHLRRPHPPTSAPHIAHPHHHRYPFISRLLFAPKRAALGLRQIGLDLPECHFLCRCYVFMCSKCVFVRRVFCFVFFFLLRECGGGGGVVVEASSWGKVCFSSSSFFCASRCRVRSVRNLANAPRPEKKMSKLIAT